MPQRKKLANRDPLDRPRMAEALAGQLFGLGQFTLRLDGYRLTAPSPLCNRLGDYCDQPFIFSLWHSGHLRIVPRSLWSTYLDSIRAGIQDPARAEDLVARLNQTLVVRLLDNQRRWDVPATLATHAGLVSTRNSVVLFPFRFWLELLSTPAWESFLTQTQQRAHSVDSCTADYAI